MQCQCLAHCISGTHCFASCAIRVFTVAGQQTQLWANALAYANALACGAYTNNFVITVHAINGSTGCGHVVLYTTDGAGAGTTVIIHCHCGCKSSTAVVDATSLNIRNIYSFAAAELVCSTQAHYRCCGYKNSILHT